MTTWEYKRLHSWTGNVADENVLNACGKLGWELVAVVCKPEQIRYFFRRTDTQLYSETTPGFIEYVFKRPVSTPDPVVSPGMESFESLGWHKIPERGWVCAVDWGRTLGEARALAGKQVMIDDLIYTVMGVEVHAMPDGHIDEKIGLLVIGSPGYP